MGMGMGMGMGINLIIGINKNYCFDNDSCEWSIGQIITPSRFICLLEFDKG